MDNNTAKIDKLLSRLNLKDFTAEKDQKETKIVTTNDKEEAVLFSLGIYQENTTTIEELSWEEFIETSRVLIERQYLEAHIRSPKIEVVNGLEYLVTSFLSNIIFKVAYIDDLKRDKEKNEDIPMPLLSLSYLKESDQTIEDLLDMLILNPIGEKVPSLLNIIDEFDDSEITNAYKEMLYMTIDSQLLTAPSYRIFRKRYIQLHELKRKRAPIEMQKEIINVFDKNETRIFQQLPYEEYLVFRFFTQKLLNELLESLLTEDHPLDLIVLESLFELYAINRLSHKKTQGIADLSTLAKDIASVLDLTGRNIHKEMSEERQLKLEFTQEILLRIKELDPNKYIQNIKNIRDKTTDSKIRIFLDIVIQKLAINKEIDVTELLDTIPELITLLGGLNEDSSAKYQALLKNELSHSTSLTDLSNLLAKIIEYHLNIEEITGENSFTDKIRKELESFTQRNATNLVTISKWVTKVDLNQKDLNTLTTILKFYPNSKLKQRIQLSALKKKGELTKGSYKIGVNTSYQHLALLIIIGIQDVKRTRAIYKQILKLLKRVNPNLANELVKYNQQTYNY